MSTTKEASAVAAAQVQDILEKLACTNRTLVDTVERLSNERRLLTRENEQLTRERARERAEWTIERTRLNDENAMLARKMLELTGEVEGHHVR